MALEKVRCPWCLKDDLYKNYHDTVWGIPERDSKELWIKLILDGQQAGLSWYTILLKQDSYRIAFSDWDINDIANYSGNKVEELLQDKGIIRNRLKVNAIIKNAKAYLSMEKEGIDFAEYLWAFTDNKIIDNQLTKDSEIPTQSTESQAMSKDLKKRGFSFVGPTICYAFMQATGMINDHLDSCWKKDK